MNLVGNFGKGYKAASMGLLVSTLIFLYGYSADIANVMLVGILAEFAVCLLYGVRHFERCVASVFFLIAFFTFLLSRPMIAMLYGRLWWVRMEWSAYNRATIRMALSILFVGLMAFLLGVILADRALGRPKKERALRSEGFLGRVNVQALKISALFLFGVSMFFYVLLEGEKLVFRFQNDYAAIYASYSSSFPSFFARLASFRTYSFCFYLALLPSKRKAMPVMAVYLISTLSELLLGARNPFVLGVIFCLLYYILRDILEDEKPWIGKIEKRVCIFGAPVGIVALGAYNYLRDGLQATSYNPLHIFADFFYKQGTSFETLCQGCYYLDGLRKNHISYTFGTVIDYILHGPVARIFGAVPIPSGNSVEMAMNFNSSAHRLSFLFMPKAYLEGYGRGTSFLLDAYVDFGIVGVFLVAMAVGFLAVYLVHCFQKGFLKRYIALISFLGFFFLPRSSATEWIAFPFYIQFWVATAAVFAGAILLTEIKKRYEK